MILAGKIADGDEIRVAAGEMGLVINGEEVETEAA
jgi:hypothetical protein